MEIWMFFWLGGWFLLISGVEIILFFVGLAILSEHSLNDVMPQNEGVITRWMVSCSLVLERVNEQKIAGSQFGLVGVFKLSCAAIIAGLSAIGCGWDLHLVK